MKLKNIVLLEQEHLEQLYIPESYVLKCQMMKNIM